MNACAKNDTATRREMEYRPNDRCAQIVIGFKTSNTTLAPILVRKKKCFVVRNSHTIFWN